MSDQCMTLKKENIIDILMINIIPILFLVAIGIYHYGWRIYIYFMIEVPVFLFVAIKMLIDYKKYCNPIICIFLVSMIITAIITLIYDRCDIHLSNLFHGPHVWALNSHMLFFIAYYVMVNYPDKMRGLLQKLSCIIFLSIVYAYFAFVRFGIGNHYRAQGFFENPIPASTIWIMGLWLPLQYKSKILELIIKILYIPPIFFSLERNAWLGLFVIIIIALIKHYKETIEMLKTIPKFVYFLILSISLLIIFILREIIAEILILRLTNIFEGVAVKERIDYFFYTVSQIKNGTFLNLIIGRGWDSSRDMLLNSPVYVDNFPMCDNAYLTSLYEYGLLRIVLVTMIIVIAFVVLRKCKDSKYSLALISCFAPAIFYDLNLCLTPMILVSSCIGFVCVQFIQIKNNHKEKKTE